MLSRWQLARWAGVPCIPFWESKPVRSNNDWGRSDAHDPFSIVTPIICLAHGAVSDVKREAIALPYRELSQIFTYRVAGASCFLPALTSVT